LRLVDRRVAVLVANTPGVLVVKAAITTTPIVFTTASDPVEIGLVASMSRPSGNVTGATTMGVELASKLLELAHELVPTASVIAALINPANNSAEPQLRGLQAAARTLGVQLHVVQASSERDFGMVFANLAELRPGALVIANDGFFIGRNEQLATLAARHALPAIFQDHAFGEIRAARCSPAPRSTPTSPQFAQRFLDFDAGGIIANNADWLDKLALHPVPGLGGSLRAAERRRLQEHPSQLRCG
jgi:ABC transporter substrate binding protein